MIKALKLLNHITEWFLKKIREINFCTNESLFFTLNSLLISLKVSTIQQNDFTRNSIKKKKNKKSYGNFVKPNVAKMSMISRKNVPQTHFWQKFRESNGFTK